jgi:hypothetical protein
MANALRDGSRARFAGPFAVAFASCAVAFAAGSSCGGGGGVTYAGGAPSVPVGSGGAPLDGGDGGGDGGDAGLDGGIPPGTGCVDAGPVTFVVDGCFSNDAGSPTSYLPTGCSVSMIWGPSSCTGTLSGPSDAFDGGCLGAGTALLTCTGSAFPGSLTCVGGLQPCAIRFCAKQGCVP